MRITPAILVGLFLSSARLFAQELPGCMDPLATNYDSQATVNNGSCEYPKTSGSLTDKGALPIELKEISGMVFVNGQLFALNDGENSNDIYIIDTLTRNITKTINLEGTTNVDWEDITSDGTYLYIADVGNNVRGNRKDLKIYRVPLQKIDDITGPTGSVASGDIQTIGFSYADQTDFTNKGPNNTDFDCEALFYDNGKLHLFTKNWIGTTTGHYAIPAQPGSYVAQRLESYDTGGIMITSAAKANEHIVVLIGYKYEIQELYPCALWIVSGFTETDKVFTTGNKRKINLGSAGVIGQIESVTAVKPTRLFISNEDNSPVSQRLYGLSTSQWVPQYVLPIEISNLSFRLNQTEVTLFWEYQSEEDAYFEVEAAQKVDGVFQKKGVVYHLNNNPRLLSFTDPEALSWGDRYYRIKIVYPDGTYKYSKTIVVVSGNNTELSFSVYPNPFQDNLVVQLYSRVPRPVQFSINDLQGKLVFKKEIAVNSGSYRYVLPDLQRLGNGIYFLKVRTSDSLFIRKLIR